MSRPANYIHAHIISDATGIAAERATRPALVQFHKRYETIFERHAFMSRRKSES